ncbi:hypothetical protein D3C78_1451260 [compost metagenome]
MAAPLLPWHDEDGGQVLFIQGVKAQHCTILAEYMVVGGGQIDLPHRVQVGAPVHRLDEVVGLQGSIQPDGEDGVHIGRGEGADQHGVSHLDLSQRGMVTTRASSSLNRWSNCRPHNKKALRRSPFKRRALPMARSAGAQQPAAGRGHVQ